MHLGQEGGEEREEERPRGDGGQISQHLVRTLAFPLRELGDAGGL